MLLQVFLDYRCVDTVFSEEGFSHRRRGRTSVSPCPKSESFTDCEVCVDEYPFDTEECFQTPQPAAK